MSPPTIKFCYLLHLYVFTAFSHYTVLARRASNDLIEKRQTSDVSPLVDFQVYEPVWSPTGASNQYGCVFTETLMVHEFANSYGVPFVGKNSSSVLLSTAY